MLTKISDDMADFVVSDESDAPSKKRKRPAAKSQASRKRSHTSSPAIRQEVNEPADDLDDEPMEEVAEGALMQIDGTTVEDVI